MHPAPASPLGQAIAAIIAMLIAAMAEHAAEHPMLAPGLRASIRKLEKLSQQIQTMAAEWETTRIQTESKSRTGTRPSPPRLRQRPRGRTAPARGLPVPTWNPARTPRAPPLPESRPALQNLRGHPGQSGAAPMYTPRTCA